MDSTDQARQIVAAHFEASGRHDFSAYIRDTLAGDFAFALAGILESPGQHAAKKAVDFAQHAINDLRRYMFDMTPERRAIMATRRQEDLDALTAVLGIEYKHAWPRGLWLSEAADSGLEGLNEAARLLEGLLDILPGDVVTSNEVEETVTFKKHAIDTLTWHARHFVKTAITDASLQRERVKMLEQDLQNEECESDHWARKATLDGDLGANPPVFLVDVVNDQRQEIERLQSELAEMKKAMETTRKDYPDANRRLAEAKLPSA